MNKEIMSLTLVLSSVLLLSTKADAFYIGGSFGQSETKVKGTSVDEDLAFSLYAGMTLPIPLIPIRGEVEYMHLKSSEDNSDVKTHGAAANAYIGLPLLPIIKPYIGVGLGYLQQDIKGSDKSDWEVTPQYMVGFDISLPIIPIAGGVEYRYIDTDFKNDDMGKYKSKIHAFFIKARWKF